MSRSEPARIAARRIRSAILAALVFVSTTTVSPPPAFGETEGAVRAGVGGFDDRTPAMANLDPRLLRALRQAARDAVDIGPSRATAWLSRHGAAYGLCRIYRNEPSHFELRPEAVDGGCPAMYADPRHDPRMQK
jgi:hypothetical protein